MNARPENERQPGGRFHARMIVFCMLLLALAAYVTLNEGTTALAGYVPLLLLLACPLLHLLMHRRNHRHESSSVRPSQQAAHPHKDAA